MYFSIKNLWVPLGKKNYIVENVKSERTNRSRLVNTQSLKVKNYSLSFDVVSLQEQTPHRIQQPYKSINIVEPYWNSQKYSRKKRRRR